MKAQQFDRIVAAAARRQDRRSTLRLLAGGIFGGALAFRGAGIALADRPDSDHDGLYDDDETDVYGTDPYVADTDGDGPDDGQEVFDGTDPLTPNGGGQAGGGDPAPEPAPAPAPAPATGGGLNERPNAAGACNPGLTLCAGFCVDVTNDFYNCGMCSNPCFGREGGYCENNFCVYPCIAAGTC